MASTEDVAPWIARLARIGFLAKGVLYATVGARAVQAALGAGGGATDTRGAMATGLDAPFGRALLVVVAAGLAGYAAWRIVAALIDPERRGTDAKGLAVRAGYLGRGIVHVALAVSAVRAAAGHASGSRHSPGQAGGIADALRELSRLGRWPFAAIALGLVAYGCYQALNARYRRIVVQK